MSILCYHAVDPRWKSPLAIHPNDFDAHCAWLAQKRTVLPLGEALLLLDRRGRLPHGLVALTFDDGFSQLQEHVFPTLARHGLPATVFLVAKTLTPEGHPVQWVDTPPQWPLSTLTLDDVLAAKEMGFEFGSHTWTHATLTDQSEDAALAELRLSREYLSDVLREEVTTVAYPRGKHDERVRRASAAAGYAFSLGLPEEAEPVGPHSVPRVGVFPGNGSRALRVKTNPHYLSLRHSRVFPLVRGAVRR